MFLLFYCEVTVGSSKQFLNGTTPLNKSFENSFPTLSNVHTDWRDDTLKKAIRHIVENYGFESSKWKASNLLRKLTIVQWA
jgi:hypothetical protein